MDCEQGSKYYYFCLIAVANTQLLKNNIDIHLCSHQDLLFLSDTVLANCAKQTYSFIRYTSRRDNRVFLSDVTRQFLAANAIYAEQYKFTKKSIPLVDDFEKDRTLNL